MLGNSIYGNGGLAIDLLNDGFTANDTNDADSGPNGLQNFPILTNAIRAAATIQIAGTLDMPPGPATYHVEFFANGSCDPSGAGEAAGLVGTTDVPVDAAGDGSFSVDISASTPTNQTAVSAIATSPSGDSSEMSPCISALPAGTVQFTQGAFATDEGAGVPATIIVSRSGRTDTTVSVDYRTFDGTATSPADYAAQQGTLTFGPGETIKSFQIPIVDDLDKEEQESVAIELSNPIQSTLGAQSKTTLLISDDDSRPSFTLLPSDAVPTPPTPGGRTPVPPATKKTYCVVPKLNGLTKKKASAKLKKAKCKLGKSLTAKKPSKNRKLKNKVVAQKPKAGKKKLKNGTKVSITLGR